MTSECDYDDEEKMYLDEVAFYAKLAIDSDAIARSPFTDKKEVAGTAMCARAAASKAERLWERLKACPTALTALVEKATSSVRPGYQIPKLPQK